MVGSNTHAYTPLTHADEHTNQSEVPRATTTVEAVEVGGWSGWQASSRYSSSTRGMGKCLNGRVSGDSGRFLRGLCLVFLQ